MVFEFDWVCLKFWYSVLWICLRLWILWYRYLTLNEICYIDSGYWLPVFGMIVKWSCYCDALLLCRSPCRDDISWLGLVHWFGRILRVFGVAQYRLQSREDVDCACNRYNMRRPLGRLWSSMYIGMFGSGILDIGICMMSMPCPGVSYLILLYYTILHIAWAVLAVRR